MASITGVVVVPEAQPPIPVAPLNRRVTRAVARTHQVSLIAIPTPPSKYKRAATLEAVAKPKQVLLRDASGRFRRNVSDATVSTKQGKKVSKRATTKGAISISLHLHSFSC